MTETRTYIYRKGRKREKGSKVPREEWKEREKAKARRRRAEKEIKWEAMLKLK